MKKHISKLVLATMVLSGSLLTADSEALARAKMGPRRQVAHRQLRVRKMSPSKHRVHLQKTANANTTLRFLGGTPVARAAQQLVATATRTGKPAMGLFVGTMLYAKPGNSVKTVVGRWSNRREQKREKYFKAVIAGKGKRTLRGSQLTTLGAALKNTSPAK